ncbi:MAG: HupU protein [bacterium]|nr:HupU protein [bacterium]
MANKLLANKNLLWLQSGGCGGCAISLLNAETPDLITSLEIAGINLLWHPSLSERSGTYYQKLLKEIQDGTVRLDILCVEGAVLCGPNGTGAFHLLAGTSTSMMELIANLSAIADHVVAIGSCTAFGGISAGGDNHTQATGLAFDGKEKGGFLGQGFCSRSGLRVINIPGCPVHPGWVIENLMMISSGLMKDDELDDWGRPHNIANRLAHHGCPRNEFYEYKASALQLSDLGCLMENLGCKGTQASADCNTRPWNGGGSCITGGYPCIACTEPGFEEPGHPFLETLKIAGIPVGLPIDMPKAWFVALSALSKAATPKRLKQNARCDHIEVLPEQRNKADE